MFSSVIIPLLLFGLLVFFHELGHFSVAKWCNVYVERFAIGFGPALLKWKWGETEYALCLFPLGGYVKMRGQEDLGTVKEEDQVDPRSFATQPVWNRIAIVIMGPVANLILPVIVFGFLFMIGVPSPSSQLGNVLPNSPAYEAGLRTGDQVLSVQGHPVNSFPDMTKILQGRAELETQITFQRMGEVQTTTVTPMIEDGMNEFGETVPQGKIGVDMIAYLPTIGISDPQSLAYQKGLRSGDQITKVNGAEITYFWQAQEAVESTRGTIELDIVSSEENKTISLGTIDSLQDAGIYSSELFVSEIQEGSIAQEKGMQVGDHITEINGTPVVSWYGFRRWVQNNQGESMDVTVIRNGEAVSLNLIPKEVETRNEFTKQKSKTRQIGVVSMVSTHPISVWKERYSNPFKAFSKGLSETYTLTVMTAQGLAKLFTGQLSYKNLGGPISIFSMASTSYDAGGWISFFRLMAILSITLGILNLLPIPVLDGGHLFFYLIEVIKGKPVPAKIMEWSQQAGLMILLGLMMLVFYVDIDRFFVDKIKAFF